MVDRQHHGAAGCRGKDAGKTVLHSPVELVGALEIKARVRLRPIGRIPFPFLVDFRHGAPRFVRSLRDRPGLPRDKLRTEHELYRFASVEGLLFDHLLVSPLVSDLARGAGYSLGGEQEPADGLGAVAKRALDCAEHMRCRCGPWKLSLFAEPRVQRVNLGDFRRGTAALKLGVEPNVGQLLRDRGAHDKLTEGNNLRVV